MATNRSRKFRGIASPVLVRERLLVRLCTTFDDTGHVFYDAPILYARLDANTSVE